MGFAERLKAKNEKFMLNQRRQAGIKRAEKLSATNNHNSYYHDTKYLKQNYGDIYKETKRYEEDWD